MVQDTRYSNLSTYYEIFTMFLQKQPPEGCSIEKGVLKNFAKFTEKHLWQSLFLQVATLLKKRLWHRCFPVNFSKFLEHLFYRTPLDDYFCFFRKIIIILEVEVLHKGSDVGERLGEPEQLSDLLENHVGLQPRVNGQASGHVKKEGNYIYIYVLN